MRDSFMNFFVIVLFQHCTLLHLCLVQQHRNRWAASPAAGAGHQHQLQRDGAGGTARLAGQERPQRLLRPGGGHRHLLSGF